MSNLTQTDDLPQAERFDFWREMASQLPSPLECYTEHEDSFWARLRSRNLGNLMVILNTSAPYGVRRTPSLIRRSNPDLLKLVMPLRGHTTVSQADRQAHLARGEFAVLDGTLPYDVGIMSSAGSIQTLVLVVPRVGLPLPTGQLGRLTAVRMGATQGVGALTAQFLVHLARNLDHYTPAEAARLSLAALDVLAARLAGELESEDWLPPETRRHALLARIHSFLDVHLGDPKLSPGVIAAAHNISLRYLHKLFQDDGTTVAGWIRGRRLEGCRADLVDPARASWPIHAIAARWGFTSPAHFAQVFKAAYGLPPRHYRHMASTADPSVRGRKAV